MFNQTRHPTTTLSCYVSLCRWPCSIFLFFRYGRQALAEVIDAGRQYALAQTNLHMYGVGALGGLGGLMPEVSVFSFLAVAGHCPYKRAVDTPSLTMPNLAVNLNFLR